MNTIQSNPYPLQPGEPTSRDEALLPLLESRIRSIQSLESLDVIDVDNKQPLDIANATIVWTKDRAAAVVERMLVVEIHDPEIRCEFCGGDHVWAGRWNLCNYCGRYNHYRFNC